MAHRKIGITIKDVALKDGKLEPDTKAMIAKLPLNKQIAIKKSRKMKFQCGKKIDGG